MVPTLAIRTKSSPGIPSSEVPNVHVQVMPAQGQLVRASRSAVIGQASPLGLRGGWHGRLSLHLHAAVERLAALASVAIEGDALDACSQASL